MSLFLDSADAEDARQAHKLGFVAGITTNPTLIARTGRPALEVIAELCTIIPGPVFYQLSGPHFAAMLAEVEQAKAISPAQVIMKVPCTLEGLRLVHHFRDRVLCAVTALFTPAQAYLAAEAGARYIIPYVNRSTRLLGDGPALVHQMVEVLAHRKVEVLAASLKSPEEAVAALQAGAQHVTLPLPVILQMAESPYTAQALAEFEAAKG